MAQSTSSYGLRKPPNPSGISFNFASRVTSIDTIFHRVIPGFLDPTGSGTCGESIYGGVFADEFHSRLRFNHRGIVAMAIESSPNTNGSQFFFTLDKCDWLDKKHTIFGKVTGDSIFNLLRLGEVDIGKDDRPLDPAPKILSVEVLWNPFEDIVPRVLAKTSHAPVDEVKESPKKACEEIESTVIRRRS